MKLLLLFLALPMIGFGQNVNIPDANFKAYLVGHPDINTNGDNQIQVSEAIAFNGTIGCTDSGISDLTGIEAFTALTAMNCGGNDLTSLDVSGCTALIHLACSYNFVLTSLNISGCTALTTLDCFHNSLTSLDVSANTELTTLFCGDNQLPSLDVSACTALFTLYCDNNQLTSLDVSANTVLTTLSFGFNQLTSLDVSANTELTWLDCFDNALTSLDVRNGNNTNFEVFISVNNPNLTCINVDDATWSTANLQSFGIDSQHYFSNNCSGAGISDINESNTLMIYPNPTNGDFTITGLELLGTVSSLTLTDMNGKVVKVLDPKATKFSMASIKPGVYFLNILSGNKEEVLKIVKE